MPCVCLALFIPSSQVILTLSLSLITWFHSGPFYCDIFQSRKVRLCTEEQSTGVRLSPGAAMATLEPLAMRQGTSEESAT